MHTHSFERIDQYHDKCVICRDVWLHHEPRPLVVCLIGSTRFHEQYRAVNLRETLAGHIVLSVGDDTASNEELGLTQQQCDDLHTLHLRKIDLADVVLVLDVDGYIGESTRGEIEYATAYDKPVRYLSQQTGRPTPWPHT